MSRYLDRSPQERGYESDRRRVGQGIGSLCDFKGHLYEARRSQVIKIASALAKTMGAATKRWLRFCYLIDRYTMMSPRKAYAIDWGVS